MTANEQYRKYKNEGGQLSFKEWIDREKKKKFVNFDGGSEVPLNKPLSDSINNVLDEIHRQSGLKTGLENKYILGINKNVWIGAAVVALIVTGVVIYQKTKK